MAFSSSQWRVSLPCALQGSLEKLSDEAVEDTLEKVVRLLAYISDKDLFAEFYRKKLARRLLFNTSASDDHERSILARLKQQCGAQFTSKARPMRIVCNPRRSVRKGNTSADQVSKVTVI